MQAKLTKVVRKEAQGSKGPYTRLLIKTQEHGDQLLSGFGRKDNSGWKEGDQVEIEVKEVQKDGKTYLNFETPKKEDITAENIQWIVNKLVKINLDLEIIKEHIVPKKNRAPANYPTAESEGIDLDKTFPDEPSDEELHDIFKDRDDASY